MEWVHSKCSNKWTREAHSGWCIITVNDVWQLVSWWEWGAHSISASHCNWFLIVGKWKHSLAGLQYLVIKDKSLGLREGKWAEEGEGITSVWRTDLGRPEDLEILEILLHTTLPTDLLGYYYFRIYCWKTLMPSGKNK